MKVGLTFFVTDQTPPLRTLAPRIEALASNQSSYPNTATFLSPASTIFRSEATFLRCTGTSSIRSWP